MSDDNADLEGEYDDFGLERDNNALLDETDAIAYVEGYMAAFYRWFPSVLDWPGAEARISAEASASHRAARSSSPSDTP